MMEGRTYVNRVATLMIGGGLLLAAGGTSEASVVCGPLSPNPVTCTQTVTSNLITQAAVPTGGLTSTLTVAQWNAAALPAQLPAGYTYTSLVLTGVTVRLFGETLGTVQVSRADFTNNSPADLSNIGLRQDFNLAVPGGGPVVSLADVSTTLTTVSLRRNQSATVTAVAPPATTSLQVVRGVADNVPGVALSSGLFAQFQGTSSLNMSLSIMRDNFAVTAPASIGSTFSATHNNLASAYVEMLYTFTLTATPVTNVPEPMSLALFGLGLLGLAAVRRCVA